MCSKIQLDRSAITSMKCYNSFMTTPLSHLDESGRARMVDVGHKPDTERLAIARGEIVMRLDTLELIRAGALKKGDVLTVAQLAGVMEPSAPRS